MEIRYDISQENFVHRLLENKSLVIGLDVAEGRDKCVKVAYCLRNKEEVLAAGTFQIKEI